MNTSKFFLGALVVVVIAAAVWFIFGSSHGASPQTATTGTGTTADQAAAAPTTSAADASGSVPTVPTAANPGTTTTAATAAPSQYSVAAVATHNSPSDCWSIINGKVYNLTSWISKHPGGPEHIEAICGIDGSSAFNAQHGGQSKPESILQSFYLHDVTS